MFPWGWFRTSTALLIVCKRAWGFSWLCGMPTFGSCENIPVSCTLRKSKGKRDVRSSARSDIPIKVGSAVSSKRVHKSFLDSLSTWVIILSEGEFYIIQNRCCPCIAKMQWNVLLSFCLDPFRGTQWKLRMCYSPVCLFECLWQHQGLNPAACWSSATRFA